MRKGGLVQGIRPAPDSSSAPVIHLAYEERGFGVFSYPTPFLIERRKQLILNTRLLSIGFLVELILLLVAAFLR